MRKAIAVSSLFVLLCFTANAEKATLPMSMVSPKLRRFLIEHPAASNTLVRTISEAPNGQVLQLYYFYTDDNSITSSYHYYSGESMVGIVVRENQEPLDEFISITFEILNSEHKKEFEALVRKARSGDVSRIDFARQMIEVEHKAEKQVRKLLLGLGLSTDEISASHFYKLEIEVPDDPKEYLAYIEKLNSSRRDAIREYEEKYDYLRKSQ